MTWIGLNFPEHHYNLQNGWCTYVFNPLTAVIALKLVEFHTSQRWCLKSSSGHLGWGSRPVLQRVDEIRSAWSDLTGEVCVCECVGVCCLCRGREGSVSMGPFNNSSAQSVTAPSIQPLTVVTAESCKVCVCVWVFRLCVFRVIPPTPNAIYPVHAGITAHVRINHNTARERRTIVWEKTQNE